jgi:GNAT superfamily N-acetyltransferase
MTAPGLAVPPIAAPPMALLAVRIRPAEPRDRPALTEMFLRCTKRTIYRRFHGYVAAFPERYLSGALAGSPEHIALVAALDPALDPALGAGTATTIVALASCADDELGILVEDAWQRRGIGTRLLAELVAQAGDRPLLASILHTESWILPVLRRHPQIKIDPPVARA